MEKNQENINQENIQVPNYDLETLLERLEDDNVKKFLLQKVFERDFDLISGQSSIITIINSYFDENFSYMSEILKLFPKLNEENKKIFDKKILDFVEENKNNPKKIVAIIPALDYFGKNESSDKLLAEIKDTTAIINYLNDRNELERAIPILIKRKEFVECFDVYTRLNSNNSPLLKEILNKLTEKENFLENIINYYIRPDNHNTADSKPTLFNKFLNETIKLKDEDLLNKIVEKLIVEIKKEQIEINTINSSIDIFTENKYYDISIKILEVKYELKFENFKVLEKDEFKMRKKILKNIKDLCELKKDYEKIEETEQKLVDLLTVKKDWISLAEFYKEKGDFDKAIECYQKEGSLTSIKISIDLCKKEEDKKKLKDLKNQLVVKEIINTLGNRTWENYNEKLALFKATKDYDSAIALIKKEYKIEMTELPSLYIEKIKSCEQRKDYTIVESTLKEVLELYYEAINYNILYKRNPAKLKKEMKQICEDYKNYKIIKNYEEFLKEI